MFKTVREMLEMAMLQSYRHGSVYTTLSVGEKLIILSDIRRIGACLSEGNLDPEWEEFVRQTEERISEEEIRREAESLQARRREFAKSRLKY